MSVISIRFNDEEEKVIKKFIESQKENIFYMKKFIFLA